MESWIETPITDYYSNSLFIALNLVLLFKSACLNDILNRTGLFIFTRFSIFRQGLECRKMISYIRHDDTKYIK